MLIRGQLLGQDIVSDLVVEQEHITAIRPAGKIRADLGTKTAHLIPPLLDIQVNGLNGFDLQAPVVPPETVTAASMALARHGVAYWIPTLITGSHESMLGACRAIAVARRLDPSVQRAIPCVHLEGPYLSPEDGARGAHAREHIRKPSLREFDQFQEAADGAIGYMTIAPEWPRIDTFIKGLLARGVKVSLGHHNAKPDQIARAVEAGASLCTHLGNGMVSMMHRHHNPLWPQVANDALAASFIADLEHLPPPVLKSLLRAKRPENTILVSDCVHLAGLKPGHYHLGSQPVELRPSGRICLSGTDLLGGSSLMLLQGIVNAVRHTDLTLEQAVASATTIPARVLGLSRLAKSFTPPRIGQKAHFVVFDAPKDSGKVQLHGVFIHGIKIDT